MSDTNTNRKLLQNFVQGGDGEVEGVIYQLPAIDKHGNSCYIVIDGTRCLCDTKEHAEALLHTCDLNV